MPSFQALSCWKQVLTHVGVGMGAASFWRGAWYVLDDQLFPEDPNKSAASSLLLGMGGMAASQGIVERALSVQGRFLKPVARFGALYSIAMSCVLVWRGTWVGWDCVYEGLLNSKTTILVKQTNNHHEPQSAKEELPLRSLIADTTSLLATSSSSSSSSSPSFIEHSPAHAVIKSTDPGHLTKSGLVSHVFAIGALGACGVFASVLAPPAAVSVIKDLAIRVAKPSSTAVAAKPSSRAPFQRASTNQALEYLPSLAGYLRTSPATGKPKLATSSSRSFFSSARGFSSIHAYSKSSTMKRF